MKITNAVTNGYKLYSLAQKYSIKSSDSSSFNFSKVGKVSDYAQKLYQNSDAASKMSSRKSSADTSATTNATASVTDDAYRPNGSQKNAGHVPTVSSSDGSAPADGTAATSGTGQTYQAKGSQKDAGYIPSVGKTSSAANTSSTGKAAAANTSAGAVTANERMNVLNSYTSYMQSALASSGLNMLV